MEQIIGEITADMCDECKKMSREEVEVLKIGVGIFGSKSVILHKNGKVENVLSSKLEIKSEYEGETNEN